MFLLLHLLHLQKSFIIKELDSGADGSRCFFICSASKSKAKTLVINILQPIEADKTDGADVFKIIIDNNIYIYISNSIFSKIHNVSETTSLEVIFGHLIVLLLYSTTLHPCHVLYYTIVAYCTALYWRTILRSNTAYIAV